MTPPVRRPVRRTASAVPRDRKFAGCVMPLFIAFIVMGAVAYIAYRKFGIEGIRNKLFPNHPDVEIIDPFKDLTNARPRQAEKPVVTGERDEEEEEKPEEAVKRKSAVELKAEAEAAERELDAEIAKARAAGGRTLPAFAGVKFGEVMNGPVVSLETLAAEGKDAGEALCYQLNGPKLGSTFRQFGSFPRVFVTPVSRKCFRIELSHPIPRRPGWTLNPETTNLVAKLAAKFQAKPYSLDLGKYPLGRHEYVFPFGETTLVVGEYGGEQLKLTVEHAGFRAEAVREAQEFRAQAGGGEVPSKVLVSDRYPNSGMVKFGRVKMKKGTPKAFAGIVFGSLPPYSVKVSSPPSRQDPRCFFIDYRKAKLEPFLNFDHGRVELSAVNGSVLAVRLHSNGPVDGLTDAEFLQRVRQAVEKRFKTTPADGGSAADTGSVVYDVGSVRITLAPDPGGGFSLSAENLALQEAW